MLLEESLPGSSLDVIHGVVGGPAVGGVIKSGLSGDTSLRSTHNAKRLGITIQTAKETTCDVIICH